MSALYIPVYPSKKSLIHALFASSLRPTFCSDRFFRCQLGQSGRLENIVIVNADEAQMAEQVVLVKTGRPSLVTASADAAEIAHRLHANQLGAFLVHRGHDAEGKVVATDILKTPARTREAALTFADKKESLADFFNHAFPFPEKLCFRRPDGMRVYAARRFPCCAV